MAETRTAQTHGRYTFHLYDRPGLYWPKDETTELIKELRACAALCLTPLPDYQCLSFAPSSLNDKIIIVARYDSPSGSIAAFMSAVLLPLPSPEDPTKPMMALHTGLSCIAPDARRSGLTVILSAQVVRHLTDIHPTGFWLTTLAEVPSSLVTVSLYAANLFPSPTANVPNAMHLHIARSISERFRDALLISPSAILDEEHFVFKGSNPPGSCFRKDTNDEMLHHRKKDANDFYRKILGKNEGNEVLQVGFITREIVLEAFREENRLRQLMRLPKANL